tara:strand:- start:1051 stop:1707 length:657 start_codon:yes stop_codon:yes gene_type:complete
MKTDWNPLLKEEFEKPYWKKLQQYIFEERARYKVFPPNDDVFAALHMTSYQDVKILILGQDPYHGEGQAHGLCFSVKDGVSIPPSLRNIFKEINTDIGITVPNHGNLESWARQGVLLLNATLTVRAHQAGSHQGKGWETFTDQVIRKVNEKAEKVVFLLWGAFARKKKVLIDIERHHVLESSHPSPFSAHRGFFGSKPFSTANSFLKESGRTPVNWEL